MCNNLTVHRQLQHDPTRTTTLRQRFEGEAGRRFRNLAGIIREAVVDRDVLALRDPRTPTINRDSPGLPTRAFDFTSTPQKIGAFMQWLRQMEEQQILEIQPGVPVEQAAARAWSNIYIQSAYQKGIAHAGQQMRKAGAKVDDTWISAAFNRPIHADRVGIIYTRTFKALEGVTDEMDKQISKILADGMIKGANPLEMARRMTDRVEKIGKTRARVIARTEVISAHHQANINALQEAQVEGVKVQAEYATAGDSRVCFPAYTRVSMPGGSRPICDISAGDNVNTPGGRQRVVQAGRRQYQGPMTAVYFSDGSHLFCTADHPIWSVDRSDWIQAQSLKINEACKSRLDQRLNVVGLVHFTLADPDHAPATLMHGFVTPSVFDRVMPVVAVNLDSDAVRDQGEIHAVGSDGVFLSVRDAGSVQGVPCFALDGRFTTECAVTSETAKAALMRPEGDSAKLRAAAFAFFQHWRPATLFRAVTPVHAAIYIRALMDKLASASGAGFKNAAFGDCSASHRAGVVPMRNARLDSEDGSAGPAFLGNWRRRATRVIARATTERTAFDGRRKRGAALPTVLRWDGSFIGRSALMRAKDVLCSFVPTASTLEKRSAAIAAPSRVAAPAVGRARHAAVFPLRGTGFEIGLALSAGDNRHAESAVVNSYRDYTKGALWVYDITVENEHCFYAENVLVHNCDECASLEGKIYTLEEARGLIPRHPNCRCTAYPALDDLRGVTLQ